MSTAPTNGKNAWHSHEQSAWFWRTSMATTKHRMNWWSGLKASGMQWMFQQPQVAVEVLWARRHRGNPKPGTYLDGIAIDLVCPWRSEYWIHQPPRWTVAAVLSAARCFAPLETRKVLRTRTNPRRVSVPRWARLSDVHNRSIRVSFCLPSISTSQAASRLKDVAGVLKRA